jgi:hypothetical protein
MNVGYFSIPDINSTDFVKLDLLDKQEVIWEGKFVKHVRFKQELEILMDGRKRTAVIRVEDNLE